MINARDQEALERFTMLIEKRLGFECADWQKQQLPYLLRERVRRNPALGGQEGYLAWLPTLEANHPEYFTIAAELTVGETYFFREPRAFEALTEHVLPELVAREPNKPLRFLSAGCASGEEPYTLALLLRKTLGEQAAGRVEIIGVDISPAALQKAENAVYSEWSLRATPHDIRREYFIQRGQDFRLRESIKAMVRFYPRNLLAPEYTFKDLGHFHVVFCRNVIIYFASGAIAQTLSLLTHMLYPGGFLFLGHSENVRDRSQNLELINHGEAFYYQRPPIRKPQRPRLSEPPQSGGDQNDGLWHLRIEESAKRVEAFTSGQTPLPGAIAAQVPPPAPSPPVRRSSPGSFRAALELIRAERFGDAVALLEAGRKSGPTNNPDVELFLAVAYFNQGHFSSAEQICMRLLRTVKGKDAADALYVLGLCYEHTGDPSMALIQYQLATDEDPDFAMPHIHRGRLLKRAGRQQEARGAYEQAAALVAQEHADRIVLFGGGFQKNALLSLCRNELSSIGGIE